MTAVEPTSRAQRAERGGTVAVPADRRLRVSVQLPHGCARRRRRGDRLAVRPELRLAERLRQPARPGGRLLPLRPVRDQPPDRARLRRRDERPRDDLEDAQRLGRRPRRADDGRPATTRTRSRRTPGPRPTTTPTTCSYERSSASRATSRSSSSASPPSTTAARPPSGRWSTGPAHRRCASGAGQTIRLQSDLPLGIEGNRMRGRHILAAGRPCVLRALVGRRARGPAGRREGRGADRRDDPLLARVAAEGADPGPPLARADPALRAHDQGPDLHADGRDRGRTDDLAARDARRGAQLGLPLHVDPRHHVHAAGAALAEPQLGGRRVHAVHRRHRAHRGRLAADHVRNRRASRPDRVHARRPHRLCGRPAGADRQRRLRPAPERRLRRGSGLDPASHPSAASASHGGSGRSSRRRRNARPGSGGSPTRASGRPAASRSTTCPRS